MSGKQTTVCYPLHAKAAAAVARLLLPLPMARLLISSCRSMAFPSLLSAGALLFVRDKMAARLLEARENIQSEKCHVHFKKPEDALGV